jgi:hypothetical protein
VVRCLAISPTRTQNLHRRERAWSWSGTVISTLNNSSIIFLPS